MSFERAADPFVSFAVLRCLVLQFERAIVMHGAKNSTLFAENKACKMNRNTFSTTSPEIQEHQLGLGQLIRAARIRAGLKTQDLAGMLHYDPSTVSKAEQGIFVSITFIEKLLEVMSLDAQSIAEFNKYKEMLKAEKLVQRSRHSDRSLPAETAILEGVSDQEPSRASLDVAQDAAHRPGPVHERVSRRWMAAIWPRYAAVGLVLLLSTVGITRFLAHPQTELGPIDFDRACRTQYESATKAVLLNPHNVYTWRCVIPLALEPGAKSNSYLADIDTHEACREQYGRPSAMSARHDQEDANSWYCYLP